MTVIERPTSERLLDGARQIGNFFRAGERCQTMGWMIKFAEGAESCEVLLEPQELCKCGAKATRFCKAKVKWLMLCLEESREIFAGEFGLAWTMMGKEWDATGLTLSWEVPEIGVVMVGPKSGITMKNLIELGADPLSGRTTLKLMKSFPGAKMEFEKVEEKGEKERKVAVEKVGGIG